MLVIIVAANNKKIINPVLALVFIVLFVVFFLFELSLLLLVPSHLSSEFSKVVQSGIKTLIKKNNI
jgi:hypothetical protein